MDLFNKEKLEKLTGENNLLRAEIRDLKININGLLRQLDQQRPYIKSLENEIAEKQRFITDYVIDVTSSKEKFAEHKAQEKYLSKKSKLNNMVKKDE